MNMYAEKYQMKGNKELQELLRHAMAKRYIAKFKEKYQ